MVNRAEELITQLEARIAELEAHCVRLGQGDAERYWEGRWRDADAQLGGLVAHIEQQDDAYALLSLDAGRKMEELVGARNHLRLQVSMQAQEARTQKAIVAEIGAMVGEPCDWLTASAVREALKAQQPSAGVVLPELFKMRPFQTVDQGSTNYKAGFNRGVRKVAELNADHTNMALPPRKPRLPIDWSDRDTELADDAQFAGWNACLDEIARLNPCRAQAVPADITELMRQASWKIEELSDAMENLTEDDPEDGTSEILTESRDIMSKIDAMLAAAQSSKKESE